MRKIKLIFLLLAISFSLTAQVTQWRGPNRDGHFTDSTLLKEWPQDGPALLLEVEGIGKGYSSAIADGEMIYTTGMIDTLDYLTAINPDGSFKYQVAYGRSWSKSFPDTRSTPVIENDRIYVQSGMGTVSCIDKESGEKIWVVNVDQDFESEYHIWGNSETPLVVDDLVIASPGGKKASVVALNKMTGETVWQVKPFEGTRGYASACVYHWNQHRFILATIGTHLLALQPESGELLWTYRWHDPEKWPQPGLIWTNTPTFKDNRIFLSMGYDYPAVMLEMDSLATSVTEVFRDQTFDNHHHGVILHDGFLYGSNWQNNKKGKWLCMNWKSGEIMYVEAWDTKGSMVMADGLLYCYNERGSVGLVKPDPDGFEPISEFKITKGAGPHWAHPFIGEHKLLIRHGDALMVYNIAE
ncbi:PQQ-binding-like beta-propeller repeat protein [uncultured Draconibacterium sp.]|uniref:outer membrane protein assembly factor BamB family protein n=1 Tax=uncultured Draconibacterium sp. TaxID=1573823 RepID=UPI0025D73DDB|nr:PQQ-binding-like beta-propeller repeat protein [uncultured Draconibacterium sp.]